MSQSILADTFDAYCARCDLYFISAEKRTEHIQSSSNHPRCEQCDRRFLNHNILRNHFTYSRYHNHCASCEIDFRTPGGLRFHIETAAVHCDDSDDEGDDESDEGFEPSRRSEEWEDEMGQLKYPDQSPEPQDNLDSDYSWEAFDDYDYEDKEDLEDPQQFEAEEASDGEDFAILSHFACPMCCKTPSAICCAPCGHVFCPPCITQAYELIQRCPICMETGEVGELRKIFLV
ncbi:hypothetical protein B0H10DRAFT_1162758 [Mycena sp. CBHHK59/15]|nr:hypothetical protein B0H10DRAFT_1162758 [Mycena sp. CBHHK59/15]